MQVPFLDLKVQYNSIKSEVDAAIQQVIDNTAFILGKAVSDFEKDFAEAHSVKHCFGTSSGTKVGLIKLVENIILLTFSLLLTKFNSVFLSITSNNSIS